MGAGGQQAVSVAARSGTFAFGRQASHQSQQRMCREGHVRMRITSGRRAFSVRVWVGDRSGWSGSAQRVVAERNDGKVAGSDSDRAGMRTVIHSLLSPVTRAQAAGTPASRAVTPAGLDSDSRGETDVEVLGSHKRSRVTLVRYARR